MGDRAQTVLFPFSIALDGLDVLSFTGTEGISQLWKFNLHLVSEEHRLNFDEVVNFTTSLTFECGGGDQRHFHGIVSRFAQGDASPHHAEYYAELAPKVWLLTLRQNTRIFQQMNIKDIITQVMTDAGLRSGTDFDFDFKGPHKFREYCVQYRESDFNFISRLLEEEGSFYFFKHDETDSVFFMADNVGAHPDCAPDNEVMCHERTGELDVGEQYVFESRFEQRVRPGKVTLNDFNPGSPAMPLVASSSGDWDGSMEIYDHPGEYAFRDVGQVLAKLRLQEIDAGRRVVTGKSNSYSFVSGHKLTLKADESPQSHTLLNCRGELNNRMFLVTRVVHRGEQRAILARDVPSEAGAKYTNTFECIPYIIPFRPPRVTRKPVIRGSQTAMVVGPEGEEIYTDEYGRVKVQFHWDREGEHNQESSCWIRFSQPSTGNKYGGISIPRVGQEVIVDFLEGDPDKPIITGRVYNVDNMPPYKLPDEKTKSTTRSNSSPGGDGFNEIRFEDAKGDEQLFMHAEKDMDVRVKNDTREWIGNDRSLFVKRDKREKIDQDEHVIVKRDSTSEIGRDHSLKIKGKNAIKVTGSHSVSVQGNVAEEFKMNHSEQVTMNYYLKGMQVVIEGMTGLTIKVGGSYITIGPAGVFITGGIVGINSGGASLSGSAGSLVSPAAPKVAEIADTAKPGADITYQQQRAEIDPLEIAAASAPQHEEPDEEEEEETIWIEIELVDENDDPVAGARYRMTLPDGETVAEGTLDENGFKRISGIPEPGDCQIGFPDLDEEAWEKI